MFKLSPNESLLYEAMMDDPSHVWTVEQLAKVLYHDSPRPKFWRASILVQVKNLRMKTYLMKDNAVVKISKYNGRGNKAKFTLRKTADRLGSLWE